MFTPTESVAVEVEDTPVIEEQPIDDSPVFDEIESMNKEDGVEEKKDDVVVYILWGNFAKGKKELITNPKHYVIESAHPSPFSARYGFFESRPFSRTNEILERNGKEKIDWEVK